MNNANILSTLVQVSDPEQFVRIVMWENFSLYGEQHLFLYLFFYVAVVYVDITVTADLIVSAP